MIQNLITSNLIIGLLLMVSVYDLLHRPIKEESIEDNRILDSTIYQYYTYLLDQRPINSLSNEPMGYRSVFFFV